MNTVFIALGSNLNNPVRHVSQGIRNIDRNPDIEVLSKSSLYISSPLGPLNQPDYINAVVKVSTTLTPINLLDKLQDIENHHKRQRLERWGPRTLDLDILIYDRVEINNARLTIPHPQMIYREFVLLPLREVTSNNFNLPKFGKLSHYIK